MHQAAWTYEEALAWLYARQKLGIKLGLEKVQRLLEAVGDPQDSFAAVHVAGTNGKGSVTRMLAEVLRRAGHRTGTTTSPHLVRFTERIEVDGRPLAPEAVAALLAALRPHVEALDGEEANPTFFEIVTVMAFCHFRDAGVQWAVVETGMGGRLDATNVLDPQLTIITNVGLDHQAHLGPTVGHIALEKAGIMKAGVPCVTACRGEALRVVQAQSHAMRAPMSIIGIDYHVVPNADHLVLLRPTGEAHYEVGLAGTHQRENAALVVAAVEALRLQGVRIPETALHAGLKHATNPGRLDLFRLPASRFVGDRSGDVEVLVDGAHNEDGARVLQRHIGAIGWGGHDLVCGFNADKDWRVLLDEWTPMAFRVWAVPLRNPRTLEPQRIVEQVLPSGRHAVACADVRHALAQAVAAGADRIVVAGSLFLAGETLAVLRGEPLEEIRGTQ